MEQPCIEALFVEQATARLANCRGIQMGCAMRMVTA
jgi:hypothetical protein